MITRFAPSPTGPLHLGHAYSAMFAFDMARAANGTFLLRIEDIDQTRARPEWERQIFDDLSWLGITWPQPVMRQSDRLEHYASALDVLWEKRLLYPCYCNRKDVQAAANAPQQGAPIVGPDGIVYPGTCRNVSDRDAPIPENVPLRLDIEKAAISAGLDPSEFARKIGDPVLSRKGMATSYHLSVVVDDAAQQITDVVRGMDLKDATPIHNLLQNLLNFPTPIYHHHRLIRDDSGKRLAKRDDARAISKYRSEGATPHDIRRLVGLPEL